MKSRSYIVGWAALGLVVTASCVLAAYMWHQQLIAANGDFAVARIFEPQAFTTEKNQIATYLKAALLVHADHIARKTTRAETKKQALALTVPAVLRDRHLQWILALDAGRDGTIEDMMQEYSTLSLVP